MDEDLLRYFILQRMKACQDTLLCDVLRLVNIHCCLIDECFSRYVILQWIKAFQDTLLCNG